MDIATLQSLLARIEKASGPDREIDHEIMIAVFGMPKQWNNVDVKSWFRDENGVSYGCNTVEGCQHQRCLRVGDYTSSLDSAVALVNHALPEFAWQVGENTETSYAHLFSQREAYNLRYTNRPLRQAPLALCQALVTALIEIEKAKEVGK